MPVGAEPTRAEIEASEWLVLLDSPSVPETEIARFQAWLAASDENRHAYAAASDTWDKIGTVLASQPRATVSSASAPTLNRADKRPMPRRRQIALATGAALAAALALAVLAPLPDFGQSAPSAAYATPVGATRTISLADGTQVQLSPLAHLSVAFDRGERRVLLSDGVAFFNVARDPTRPFIVATRFGDVAARSSSFAVRINADGASVTVMDGEVTGATPRGHSLFARLQNQPAPEIARAGQELCLGDNALAIATLSPAEVQNHLAWRRGTVSLANATLADAAGEVARFSGSRFAFADRATAQTRVSGYFDGGDVDAFLTALQANFGIEAERQSNGDIRLRRQHPAATR